MIKKTVRKHEVLRPVANPKQKEPKDTFLHRNKINRRAKCLEGKGHGKGRRKQAFCKNNAEDIGVGFCYHQSLEPKRRFYKAIDGREIHIEFNTAGPPLILINYNFPQQGRPPNE